MKIVQALGWYFPESVGGTETYVSALARLLRSRGHEVSVSAPEVADGPRRYVYDGIEVFRYSIPQNPTRGECQGDLPVRGASELHHWLKRTRPDVFHCHSLVTGLGLREIEAAKNAAARVFVTFHTPGLGYLCQRGTMMRWGREICDGIAEARKCASCDLQHRGLPKPLASLLGAAPVSLSRKASSIPGLGIADLIERNIARQKRLVDLADGVFVLTEWARRVVEANLGPTSKLHLNRLGVAAGRFHANGRREHKRPLQLGYLGRFDPIKGVLVLARALAHIPGDLEFTLEVRGPFRDRDVSTFRSLARNDRRVRFAEAASPGDVPEVLASYDLLVCPSIAVEGGPTVALEAHAVGTPVVGSRIGGLAEIIEDGVNGQLAPPADPEALARVIEAILRNPGGTIDRWRERLPEPRTMDDVGRDYLRFYEASGAGPA